MPFIEWTAKLSVGIEEIDREHRTLVGMINELDDAMYEGKSKDMLGQIINRLVAYAVTHFHTEESYFDLFGYPAADAHKAEHESFRQKTAEFKTGFEAGTIGLSFQVMDFLSQWVQNHIQSVDKQYAPFLLARGLK